MNDFKSLFLENYLKFGLGSMSKQDVDSLVMSLLDRYGSVDHVPLAKSSNQDVSEFLKTPVSKIKKLRYDAALKFGGHIEEEAQGRLLAALANASLETEGSKICLIIEDSLAKNWLQGKLKKHHQIFDYSFNAEIVKVSGKGLFQVLDSIFDKKQIDKFRDGYKCANDEANSDKRIKIFKEITMEFAKSAATAAGGSVYTVVKNHLGIT
ncbi:MAG: hypothetical protein WCL19_08265 [Verrucomicrobiota bacterium]